MVWAINTIYESKNFTNYFQNIEILIDDHTDSSYYFGKTILV